MCEYCNNTIDDNIKAWSNLCEPCAVEQMYTGKALAL